MQTRQVIDLLPDRKAGSLAKWMKGHIDVYVISKDRCGAYALGSANGAPHALYVADRFHLIKNLGEATNNMFQNEGKILQEVMTSSMISRHFLLKTSGLWIYF